MPVQGRQTPGAVQANTQQGSVVVAGQVRRLVKADGIVLGLEELIKTR